MYRAPLIRKVGFIFSADREDYQKCNQSRGTEDCGSPMPLLQASNAAVEDPARDVIQPRKHDVIVFSIEVTFGLRNNSIRTLDTD